MHEQDVDVRGVVELRPAELAEADHGDPVGRQSTTRDRRHVSATAVISRTTSSNGAPARSRAARRSIARRRNRRSPASAPKRSRSASSSASSSDPERARGRAPLGLFGMRTRKSARRRREAEEPRRDRQHLVAPEHLASARVLPHPRERDPRELGIGSGRERPAEVSAGTKHRSHVRASLRTRPVSGASPARPAPPAHRPRS